MKRIVGASVGAGGWFSKRTIREYTVPQWPPLCVERCWRGTSACTAEVNNPSVKNQTYAWFLTWCFANGEVRWSAGVAKKAARGDDLETLVAKKGFSGDGGRGRFAKGPAKAQVTDGLFSAEAIIHFAIVTVGAVFGRSSSLPRPFLARALPNPSPRNQSTYFLWSIRLATTSPRV